MEDGVPLSQIPREVVAEAGKAASDFAIGFVALRGSESDEDAELGGSGTLVQADGTRGILTAYHVLEHLAKQRAIGLIVVPRDEPVLHRVSFKPEAIHPVRIAFGKGDADGPDLGLLVLSSVDAASLSARKSFYNLLVHREAMLSNPPGRTDGIWLLCGFADEFTTEQAPDRGFTRVKVFRGACGAGWVETEYCRGHFDYLEFEVRYGGIDEPPQSFGGFSGAGLWQARLLRTPDGALTAERPTLSGVAFYESPLTERRRVITCHGRRSIYVHAVDSIQSLAS